MYSCRGYVVSTFEILVISIFGYSNLSFPLFEHFIKDTPHSRSTQLINMT